MSNLSDAQNAIIRSIRQSLEPHGKIDLIDWCKHNVPVVNSQKGSTVDLNLTPYFKEIYMEALTNPNITEIYVCSPIGVGKTTMVSALMITCAVMYPKQMMYVSQSEENTISFLNNTLKPAMKKNRFLSKIWPRKPNDKRDSIFFPSFAIQTGYATSLPTLQSKSIDMIICDEIWLFTQEGVIQEALSRLHNRNLRKFIGVSQGGVIGDQFHTHYSQGQLKEYAWTCEKCHEDNIYKFADIKFTYSKEVDGTPIWNSVETCMECPHCKHQYDDTVEIRRRLSEHGKYVVSDPEQNFKPGVVSYNFNKMAAFDIPWNQLVIDFLAASKSIGKITALRQWEQKHLGKFFDERHAGTIINISDNQAGYAMDEFKDHPMDLRLMAVDVQQSQFFLCIRDYEKHGKSRLVAAKFCSTFSDIERIRMEYGIKPKCVFVDAAYNPEIVKMNLAQYNYIGLNGRSEEYYRIKENDGRTYGRLYSQPVNYQITQDNKLKTVQVVNYSSIGIKDVLNTMMEDKSRWQIPSHGENMEMYLKQMDSEVRKINPQTGKPYYKKIYDSNHFYDCENMLVVGATIWKVLATPITELDATSS